jgi:periplasmic protein CpxP/Spy
MKKIIIISVSVVTAALIGLAAAGGFDGGAWHRTPEEMVAHIKAEIAEKLDLNEDQKTTLDRIAGDMLAEHQELVNERLAFKSRFMDALRSEHVDSRELKSLFDSKKPTIDRVMQMAAEHISEFHSMLTPEQREILVAEIEAHHGRRCRFAR